LLATQVVKMILKIDDVITPSEFWDNVSWMENQAALLKQLLFV
jgi:hypothetical protein